MTSDERRAALHALIHGHADTIAALRKANQDIAVTNRSFDEAHAAFIAGSQAIQRMVDAHELAFKASEETMRAALALLDDARGVQ